MNETYGTRSLREIVRILFQHWLMLVFIVGVGAGGTYVICKYYAPRIYRSRVSLIYQRPLNKSPISTDQSVRPLEVFVKAQQQILTSDLVMARAKVISENPDLRTKWYDLQEKWTAARKTGGAKLAQVQEEIDRLIGAKSGKGEVATAVQALLDGNQKDMADFRDSVELQTPGGEQVAMTNSFTITMDRRSDPKQQDSHLLAKYAVDILADMYMIRYQELQEELNAPALQVTRDIIDKFKIELEGTLKEYEDFVKAHSDDIGVLEQLLKSGTPHGIQIINTEIRKNNAKLSLDLARDKAINEVLATLLPENALEIGGIDEMSQEEVEATVMSIPYEFLKDNVKFGELLKGLAKLEAKRAKAETQFTEVSRNVRYVRGEIEFSQRQLLKVMVAHARGLAASIQVRQQQKAENMILARATAEEQSGVHKNLAEYAMLKNNFEVAQKHLEKLEREKIEAMANQLRASETLMISKLNAASTPQADRPVSPKTLLFTIVAFIVSTLFGVAGAFMADHFDHTLRSTGEAERYLGVPVLGSVKKQGRRLLIST